MTNVKAYEMGTAKFRFLRSVQQAKDLVTFLQGLAAKVNLIPYNENPRFPDLKAPDREQLLKYRDRLMKAGFHTTIRKNRGNGIFGACGQLSSSKYGP